MRAFFLAYFLLSFVLFSSCTKENTAQKEPQAIKGVLHLRLWDFEKQGSIDLNGDWELYWNQLLFPKDFESKNPPTTNLYVKVPGVWNDYLYKGKKIQGKGSGTYRLKIYLGKAYPRLTLKVYTASTAFGLYMNGKKISQSGKVGTSSNTMMPEYKPHIVSFENTQKELEILVQVSNFHYRKGGLWRTFRLGLEDDIWTGHQRAVLNSFFLIGAIFMMGCYHFGLYTLNPKDKSILLFAVLCFLVTLRVLTTEEYLLTFAFPINWFLLIRLEFFSFFPSVIIFLLFLESLFKDERLIWFKYIYLLSLLIYLGFLFFTSPSIFTYLIIPYQLFCVILGLYMFYVIGLALYRKRQGSTAMLVGFLVLIAAFMNDVLHSNYLINTGHLISLGLLVFTFAQTYLLSQRFNSALKNSESLSKKLEYANKNLENLVIRRTSALQEVNEQLKMQYDLMEAAAKEMDKKNKQIRVQSMSMTEQYKDLTDSLEYAHRIQKAFLPEEAKIKAAFKDAFVFFKPRDIVSGDFYWFAQKKDDSQDKIIIAVADSTGHGVPGAFLSLVGDALLNQIVHDREIHEPDKILIELHKGVRRNLNQYQTQNYDGIVLALCTIDFKRQIMSYAGAENPIYYIQNNELKQIKGDNIEIGGFRRMEEGERIYTKHDIDISIPTVFYLFSDGYQDQFGGERGGKFMTKRFRALLFEIHQKPMQEQKNLLKSNLLDWIQRAEAMQTDDILVLGAQL